MLEGQKEILDSEIKQVTEAQLDAKWVKAYAQLLIDLFESKDFYTRKNFLARMVEKIEVKDKEIKIAFRPFVDPNSLPVEEVLVFDITLPSKKPSDDPRKKKELRRGKKPEFSQKKYLLPRMDSNHDNKIQNLVSYH